MQATIQDSAALTSPIDEARGAQVRSGSAEVFEQIVAQYQAPLIRYLRRMTRCEERARDLAQESFVRLYATRARYREEGLIGAYLYRIATNLLRSEERRRSRWRLLEPSFRSTVDDGVEATDREVERSESGEQVRRAIADLPTRFRAPLVLREIEGWSYSQIAQALGCREGTAKSRVNRAKQRLRQQLATYWQGEVS